MALKHARQKPQHYRQKKVTARGVLSAILLCAGAALVLYYVVVNWVPKWYREFTYWQNLSNLTDMDVSEADVSQLDTSQADPLAGDNYPRYTYPTDRFFLSDERKAYQNGDMTLRVPRLAYEGEVRSGTTQSVLKYGPGLYRYSALPSYGNPNVCIAGHRGVYGAEFYNIDKFEEGDKIYLDYNGYRFTYAYVETIVVPPNDWGMIYCADYSAITLTSCHPMDTSADRMCVRGKLIAVEELPKDSSSSG